MAKALKKRALAEYSQTIVESPSTSSSSTEIFPPKRLRLRKPAPEEEDPTFPSALEQEISALDPSRPAAENFRSLSRIATFFPASSAAVEAALLPKLRTLFLKEKNSALRAKCLTLMQLMKGLVTDLEGSMEEVARLLSNEASPLVLISGLNFALKLAEIEGSRAGWGRLMNLAKKLLKCTDAKVKCKCLQLIGVLTLDGEDQEGVEENIKLIQSYSHSHEPRIRSTAFKTMVRLHEKGAKLDVSVYQDVSKYLDDDYESVRIAAIQLLWSISQTYSEHLLPTPSCPGEMMRLIDDAFAKVCHAINDSCVQVRVLAATLLGKMPQVSQSFLDQTLDKKLMSDMRRKKSAHERQWEKVKSGEWSSGKKWADDAPQEVIDADSVTLISSGAAGAFVHGLEDEFMEVRSAAVDSLCTLALKSTDFSNLALDFLVDMFNDEIEEVRLKAIDSLTKISKHIVLWEDQLETILGALEDSSIDIREGLHKLLSVCHLMTKDCVKMVLDTVLDNLKKYPQDKRSIWKCLEGVGKNHPWVILPLVPQLLSMHPFFDTSEPDPEDPAYVSVLIMVFNASKGCNTMATLFDEKLLRHYHYLRDTLPHLVPEINLGNEINNLAIEKPNPATSLMPCSSGRLVLKELTSKLKNSQELSADMRQRLSKLILKDLKRIASIDEDISAVAKFTALYVRAQLVYTNCLGSSMWMQLSQNSFNEPLKQQIRSFLQLCLKMQYSFSGLSPQEFAVVLQLKLRALAFQLVYIVKGSNASALASCQFLVEQAEAVQKYLEQHNLTADDFTTAMFQMLDQLDDPKPGTVAKLLLPLFEKHPIPLVAFNSQIKMTTATIMEPTGESDTPVKFTAGLLLGINFDAEIYNLEDVANVRIQVTYPDQQVHLISPRLQDFRKSGENLTRLLTTVRVSHQAWTEPCPVMVALVLDLSGPEANFNRKLVERNDSTYVLKLSEEKQVLVSPKPAKRGI